MESKIKKRFEEFTRFIQECGKVIKPWKLKGEIIIKVEQNLCKKAYKKNFIFIGSEGSKHPTPYRIQKIKHLDESNFLVKLKGIESRNDAKLLQGLKVFALIKKNKSEKISEEQYIGKNVREPSLGLLGKVIRIEEYPADKMLVVKNNSSGKEILIPFSFIKNVSKIIEVSLPEGFLEAQS